MLYYLSSLFFFILSLVMFFLGMIFLNFKYSVFLEWILLSLNSSTLNMFIYLDWICLMFFFLVFMISSMIMLYCVEYMSHEIYKVRFFYLLSLFIMSMILMVISPNMVSIILGWDGLGLVSYCLVIYYQSYFSYSSGMVTVLMNRVGDIMIMFSILLLFSFGSWNFMNLNHGGFLLLFLVVLASFTKSAQFPFSSWLPAAMAAPTPVSSLVHSSTLVTAGVYLLIRFNFLIFKDLNIVFFISAVGMITMMMAGFSAIFEYDLKKIIAFSTLSQLGLMMLIYGMKFFLLSYFHLLIHAMFKSMMFMCSGIIIHSMNNIQDIRFMGNLINFMPMTLLIMMISNFSLCGLPFMSGFYSKDLILEKAFMLKFNFLMFLFLIVSTMLTVIYSFRLFFFLVTKNFMHYVTYFKVEDLKLMNYSLLVLMFSSIFMGFFFNWVMFLFIEEIFLMFEEKVLVIFICLFSLYILSLMFKVKFSNNKFMKFFFGKMWMLYYLNSFIVLVMLNFMKNHILVLDKGWNEKILNTYFDKFILLMSFNINKNMLNILFLMISYLCGMYLFL